MIAQVALDSSAGKIFNYLIPESLQNRVEVGTRVQVPLRERLVLGTIIGISSEEFTPGLRPIHGTIGSSPMIRPALIDLALWMAEYYCTPLEVALRCILPPSVREAGTSPKERRILKLLRAVSRDEISALQKKAPRQAQLLALLNTREGRMALVEAGKELSGVDTLARGLERRGLICIEKEPVYRDPFSDEVFLAHQAPPLSKQQGQVLDEVIASIQKPHQTVPLLLHGVTGSGKTEIYLGAIQEALRLGRTAIVLVPEISLTPQTVERFKSRFASIQEEVVVAHSHLSKGERFDAWNKMVSRQARIVIGTRSAVFSPLQNLGLIVVDEEHESSYKQEEAPRYNARDLAVFRATREGCAILLGSATPSLESFLNARNGKYRLLRLAERADNRSMPLIRILDLRRLKQRGSDPILTPPLCSGIEERLVRNEQVILFLNRRGFSTSLLCTACGHVCQCPNCSLSLTYHRADSRLICHLCGHRAQPPAQCPGCNDPAIRHSGIGTQKIEEISRRLFPTARIARMDADSMTRKNAHRDILGRFKARQIDLLIGTQMIAKGLHFPNVTLVGIINADLGLHLPDFRAGERTFQLLTQVAGRAGRGEMQGEVFVQTFTPFSPSIQFARHHDYAGFFEQEIQFRECFSHPPFSRLILLTIRSTHRERAEFSVQTLARKLTDILPPFATLGEPAPAPLERAKGQFRFHLSIRTKNISPLTRLLRPFLDKLSLPPNVHLSVDVDPYQLL